LPSLPGDILERSSDITQIIAQRIGLTIRALEGAPLEELGVFVVPHLRWRYRSGRQGCHLEFAGCLTATRGAEISRRRQYYGLSLLPTLMALWLWYRDEPH